MEEKASRITSPIFH